MLWGVLAVVGLAVGASRFGVTAKAIAPTLDPWAPTPDLACGAGDHPEAIQGRIPAAD
ncbi:MAG: hypothetical protein V7636_1930, partial [Actinomycetota bacterium]